MRTPPWVACIAPDELDVESAQIIADCLFRLAVLSLQRRRQLPMRGLRLAYRADASGVERQWWAPRWVLANGGADCKALAAFRAAELYVAGDVGAHVVVVGVGADFHVLVEHGDGRREDVARVLGMRGAA